MNKPIGFQKLADYAEPKKTQNGFRIVIADRNAAPDSFWIFPEDERVDALLCAMDWKNEKLHIRVCLRGAGHSGIWHDTYLPFYKSNVQSVGLFYSEVCGLYNMFINFLKGNTDYPNYVKLNKSTMDLSNIPLVVSENRPYIVKSSNGTDYYTVTLTVDEYWECSCPGYMFSKQTPKTCKHITEVKTRIKW